MTKTRSSLRISSAIASRRASRTVVDTSGVPSGTSGSSWVLATSATRSRAAVSNTCGVGVASDFCSAGSGAAGASAAAGAGAGVSLTVSPSAASKAIGCPTFTPSLPSGTRILAILPSSTASNSIVALSVSISARMSPERTSSPSLTSHLASVPSSIVGDKAGILSSVAISSSPPGRQCRAPWDRAPARLQRTSQLQPRCP